MADLHIRNGPVAKNAFSVYSICCRRVFASLMYIIQRTCCVGLAGPTQLPPNLYVVVVEHVVVVAVVVINVIVIVVVIVHGCVCRDVWLCVDMFVCA